MSLKFDHAFTADPGHGFLKKLERLGFALSSRVVEHPGGSVCRFIFFNGRKKRDRVYLEFVHTKRRDRRPIAAGFSFGTYSGLENEFKKMLRRGLNVDFYHRDYDWKEKSTQRRPGWNFVNFKNTGIRGFYPWVTEYESTPEREKRLKKPLKKHRAGDLKVSAFHFQVNAKGLAFFERLLAKKILESVTLVCGTRLYFSKGRTNKLKTVVLESENFLKTVRAMERSRERNLKIEDDLIWIPNSDPRGWDLLIRSSSSKP